MFKNSIVFVLSLSQRKEVKNGHIFHLALDSTAADNIHRLEKVVDTANISLREI